MQTTVTELLARADRAWWALLEAQIERGEVCAECNLPRGTAACGHDEAAA